MSGLEELRELGYLGTQGIRAMRRIVWEELERFPQLLRSNEWAGLDVGDVVQEFLVDKAKQVTAMLTAAATDEDAFGRLLRRSIRNWLIDQVRKTDRGAIRRRLEVELPAASVFEKVPEGEPGAGSWRVVGEEGPSEMPRRELIEAAWTIDRCSALSDLDDLGVRWRLTEDPPDRYGVLAVLAERHPSGLLRIR
ncbi:MAG: hypothetical protein QOG10_3750 [Kribbellaceae bacterium]|nr:hypothetical protein [Kribbellaceae bacterium]